MFIKRSYRQSPGCARLEPVAATNNRPARVVVLLLGTLAFYSANLDAQNAYVDRRLVSDLPGVAEFTDTNLLNPWGIAFSANGAFWISDNHAGVSTLYNSSGTPQTLIVNIPTPASGAPPSAPTGMIFNNTTGFTVAPNFPARFIFSTEDGTIVGWNSGTNAVLEVDNSASGAVYKGLAFGAAGGSNYLYATDFHNGKVDVFDSQYRPASLAGSFSDPSLPAGLAPFGIENVNGQLFVTYAVPDADKHDDVQGPGNGCVNVFDTSGNFVKRFAISNVLNSPWGIARAPAGFGPFGGRLLIGNFGDGAINAFDPGTGTWLGSLTNAASGTSFGVDGLWALKFGNGGNGGDAHTLYYTAGIAGPGALEDHGLFGSLAPVFPSFTSVTNRGLTAALSWAGGVGPFTLQQKAGLADQNWTDLLTTSGRSLVIAREGGSGFLRVANQATNLVLPFTVLMNGASELPAVTTPATAVGTLSLAGSNLSYRISFSGLSGPATAAHIHGGTATNNAGVMVPFSNVPAAASGIISGTASLTPDQVAAIISGSAYANIHTANHGSGEIRGQVVPLRIPIALNGASEVPAVATGATGTGLLTLVGSELYYDLKYSGLQGPAIAAHIHGPADATAPANVLLPLSTPSGTNGSISGTVSLGPTNMAYLLAGLTYINIHSTVNGGGEIRGQIYPMQFGASLNGASEVPPTTSPGSGTASMSLVNGMLSYSISFKDLGSPASAAHIHGPADAGHNASPLIPFTVPAATSGTISGTALLTPQQVLYLVSGLTYVNIHTTVNGGGEIRGQIVP
ncbi:MAG TPA: TIGR03118 family protein [Verrucomicrobiae bacterium]